MKITKVNPSDRQIGYDYNVFVPVIDRDGKFMISVDFLIEDKAAESAPSKEQYKFKVLNLHTKRQLFS
ncbi:hypothetical protein LJB98_01720 [Bacteroidales bacterium OttesenSCG-928-M11]|nr:hypothetical protein [Bacteroidales bacterium OttesenSCG-928-M11]